MSYVAKKAQPLEGFWAWVNTLSPVTRLIYDSGAEKDVSVPEGGAVSSIVKHGLTVEQRLLAEAEAERIAKEKAEASPGGSPGGALPKPSTFSIVAVGAAVWFLFFRKKR